MAKLSSRHHGPLAVALQLRYDVAPRGVARAAATPLAQARVSVQTEIGIGAGAGDVAVVRLPALSMLQGRNDDAARHFEDVARIDKADLPAQTTSIFDHLGKEVFGQIAGA